MDCHGRTRLSFTAFKNSETGEVKYAFPFDSQRLGEGMWLVLPHMPNVVLATAVYDQEPYLDSIKSLHELDRQLNIEAEQAREDIAYQIYRKES